MGDQAHASQILGGADVDCAEPRVGVRTPQEGGVQRAGQLDVVHVATSAR
jgi:hypothetical protein